MIVDDVLMKNPYKLNVPTIIRKKGLMDLIYNTITGSRNF